MRLNQANLIPAISQFYSSFTATPGHYIMLTKEPSKEVTSIMVSPIKLLYHGFSC